MRQEANEHFELAKGGLNVGTVHAGSVTLLPRVFRRFCARYRAISIQLKEAGSCAIADEVRARRLDLGVVTCMVDVAPNLSNLIFQDLFESRLVLCVPLDHRLAKRRKEVSVGDFADESLIIFPPGYCMHEVIRSLFSGQELRIPYHTDNPESAKRMVAAGIGVTVFPELTIAAEQRLRNERVAYLRITDERAVVKLRAVRRTEEWISRPAEIFWEMLRAESIGAAYHDDC